MSLGLQTFQWITLLASAVGWGILVVLFARAVLASMPARRVALPLAISGGLRALVLGTCMLSLVAIAVLQGSAVFYRYDEDGELTLITHFQEWGSLALLAGVLTFHLDLVYMLSASLRGHRGLWGAGFGMLMPFVALVVLFLADIGLFVPMV